MRSSEALLLAGHEFRQVQWTMELFKKVSSKILYLRVRVKNQIVNLNAFNLLDIFKFIGKRKMRITCELLLIKF